MMSKMSNITKGGMRYNLLAEAGDEDARKKNSGISGFLRNVTTRKSAGKKQYIYKIHEGECNSFLYSIIISYESILVPLLNEVAEGEYLNSICPDFRT